MSYDYLGLGKPKKLAKNNFDTNFIDMNSDYTGLGSFASARARDVGQARKYVKSQARQYRNDINEIKREAKEFRKDFDGGGWIGKYISRKRRESKAKNQLRNLKAFSDTVRSKRR